MANVNLSLDEIIKTKKKSGGGGGAAGGRRSGGNNARGRAGPSRRAGGGGRDHYFSDDVPSGKWKHDKYFETYGGGGGGKRAGGSALNRPGVSGGARRSRGGTEMVKLNISNLPASVIKEDLEELFQDFNYFGVAVHYDEGGAHLGTATLFVAPSAAKDIVREYANIAIDGQEIKIGIVDESGRRATNITDRIRRIGGGSPQRRRVGRRSDGGRVTKPGAGRRSGGGGGRGAKKAPVKKMTVEELDKELESYMNKAKE